MRITREKARCLVQVLEDAREDYQRRDGDTSTLWERQRKGILDRLKDLTAWWRKQPPAYW